MSRLIGNRVAEKDIRDWLSDHGFYGSSALFSELELHAIQRPGWLQIFRFQIEVKAQNGERHSLYGVLRDDDRSNRLDIEVFEERDLQRELLDSWSENLIVRPDRHRQARKEAGWSTSQWVSLVVMISIVAAIAGIAIWGRS